MPNFITKSGKLFVQLPGPVFIATSFGGGILLGALARLWMRWIAPYPEFTWSGTLTIVLIFTFFATAQSLLFVVRRKDISKLKDWIFRGIAIFFTLPLFMAAGLSMFPTVVLGSLALWRKNWPKWLRSILGLASITFAAMVADLEIIAKLGWSFETIGRVLLFVGIYSLVIGLTKGAVAFPRKSI